MMEFSKVAILAMSIAWATATNPGRMERIVIPAAAAAGRCVFCNSNMTFDFSGLSNNTFIAHSGTKGQQKGDAAWTTYLVTSPCASVAESDWCVAGPTTAPVAIALKESTPVCEGLGSLGGAKPVAVTTASAASGTDNTVNITLHQAMGGGKCTTYRMVCDRTVPTSHPPDPAIVVDSERSVGCAATYTVTWRHPSACGGAPTPPSPHGCAAPAPPPPAPVECKACLPPWRPTWNMSRSTALYTCNASGMHDVDEAIRYGITVYDWSNAKHLWVNAQPMNDQELLTKQAEMVLAADPGIPGEQPRVWVYRNKIKGLNWYSSVREKLDDPRYAGWFAKFTDYKGTSPTDPVSNNSYHVPACDWYGTPGSPPKCSQFYHDQRQSPTRLGPGLQGSPGAAYCTPSCMHDSKGHGTNQSCINTCDEQCDCGVNPCGEYTFDHRNASFAEWWVNEYMISNDTLRHTPMINLGWLDDGMGLSGMSEASPGWVEDTGSSLDEMQDHVDAFNSNIATLQRKVVELGGFYWQMIRGFGPGVSTVPPPGNITKNCHEPKPRKLTPTQCATTLRGWCPSVNSTGNHIAPDTPATRLAHLYFVCPLMMQDPALALDFTAEFLLSRGPFAWIGYGWSGCAKPYWDGTFRYPFQLQRYPRPELWDRDYGGEPAGTCRETGANTGVFERRYPKATVRWDCNTAKGSIDMD